MRVALALAFTLAATAPAFADTLVVPIDHSTRVAVRGQAASVVVGNPQVADVTVVDSHTLFVSGRGYGQTDVVVLDHAGRTLYSGDVLVASAEGGRVSVYRGAERTDMACAPACAVSTRSPTAPSKGGEASSGGGGSNPLASVAAGIGGAASSVGSAVAHGVSGASDAATPG